MGVEIALVGTAEVAIVVGGDVRRLFGLGASWLQQIRREGQTPHTGAWGLRLTTG